MIIILTYSDTGSTRIRTSGLDEGVEPFFFFSSPRHRRNLWPDRRVNRRFLYRGLSPSLPPKKDYTIREIQV